MYITIFLTLFIFSSIVFGQSKGNTGFYDVPSKHWAETSINQLRKLNITDGIGGNEFGLGKTINRNEFVTFLVKLMGWELITPEDGSFIDVYKSGWDYPYIETALSYGIILDESENFRGSEPITREEMAIMIVRALGYESLSKQLEGASSPFNDVSQSIGHITLAKDFGIINGVGKDLFKPYNNAKREEAAAMMMRMHEKLNTPLETLHGFYAIRSFHQAQMIDAFNSIGFGWSRLEYDSELKKIVLNTTTKNNNEYSIPTGFMEPIDMALETNAKKMLMLFAQNSGVSIEGVVEEIPLIEYVISDPKIRRDVIKSILEQMNRNLSDEDFVTFDGVIIDFEELRGETIKKHFNEFLGELRKELGKKDKLLYVAVHPARSEGKSYYDAYDFRKIGDLADKVILMAHDYYAKQLTDEDMESGYRTTPLTPIDEIYWALRYIVDEDHGVQDTNKVLLQISFDSVQWKLKDGKIINRYPYKPDYEAIRKRLLMEGTAINYSERFQNPYATFYNNEDESQNIIWYEDSRSIEAKINLGKMFGIKGISVWRIGNIPSYEDVPGKEIHLDIWQQLLNFTKDNAKNS